MAFGLDVQVNNFKVFIFSCAFVIVDLVAVSDHKATVVALNGVQTYVQYKAYTHFNG